MGPLDSKSNISSTTPKMTETFGSIKVVTQDGSHELDVRDVPRAQRLELFKSRVAVQLSQSERKYINPADLDLFVFSEKMEDGGTSMSGACSPSQIRYRRVDR